MQRSRMQTKRMENKKLKTKATSNVNKKTVQPNIAFIFNILSGNEATFNLSLKSKYNVDFTKTLFLKTGLFAHSKICINVLHLKYLLHGTTHLHNYAVTEKL